MKATKTFIIGEYCKGGIITANVDGNQLTIIGKEYVHGNKKTQQKGAKEWCREVYDSKQGGAERELDNFLCDLTTSYYAGKVTDWAKTKGIKFESGYGYGI